MFRNNKCTEKTWKKVAKDITSIQSLDRLKPFVRNILKGLNDYEKDSLTQVKGEDVSFFMTETLISWAGGSFSDTWQILLQGQLLSIFLKMFQLIFWVYFLIATTALILPYYSFILQSLCLNRFYVYLPHINNAVAIFVTEIIKYSCNMTTLLYLFCKEFHNYRVNCLVHLHWFDSQETLTGHVKTALFPKPK